ncbi:thioesterase II family protein [Micromonospora sp. DT53]|uniref:thioesterase II family protein n=1 Tax=Micromonospora sp. DT53 TaxID=3393444 RepID=UPI003CE9FD26
MTDLPKGYRIHRGHVILERPSATVRLLAFHHAAGSAMSYLRVARDLPSGCEPVLVELPGRGGRADERRPQSFAAALAQVLDEIAVLVDRPTILVGTSLGALFAHNVAASLRGPFLRAVLACACPAPGRMTAARPANRSPSQLLDRLCRDGQLPPSLAADLDLRDYLVGLLIDDLRLADTYEPPDTGPPAGIGYHYWFGAADQGAGAGEAAGWSVAAQRQVAVRQFSGGHFFLQEEQLAIEALAALITDQIGHV